MDNSFQQKSTSGQMAIRRISSFAEYKAYINAARESHAERKKYMLKFTRLQHSFTVPGHCFVCDKDVEFTMNVPSAEGRGNKPLNWREGVSCPGCLFNNRTRAAIHIFQQECLPSQDATIYMTEQTTRLFRYVKEAYHATVGSEYLGDEVALGNINGNGLRNESLTNLTFPDNAFDFILSFDVLEHVPDYRKGFAECLRCLKPGGKLLFSVPFVAQNESTLMRATVGPDGTVTHLLTPEYHGDPINSKGCLCFYHFGWDMLNSLRDLGFEKAEALLYWSSDLGYLGNADQIIFLAQKKASMDRHFMKKFAFICGAARSGTSALWQLISAHDEVAIGLERYIGKALGPSFIGKELFERERFFDLQKGDTFLKSLDVQPYYGELFDRFDNCKLYGDKIPRLYEHYQRLDHVFEKPKILFIVRNIFDVASSYNKRVAGGKHWPKNRGAKAAVADWNKSLLQTLENFTNSDILVIEYEGLFSGRANIKKIFDFLGLNYKSKVELRYKQLVHMAEKISANKETWLSEEEKRYICLHGCFDAYSKLIALSKGKGRYVGVQYPSPLIKSTFDTAKVVTPTGQMGVSCSVVGRYQGDDKEIVD